MISKSVIAVYLATSTWMIYGIWALKRMSL